MGFSGSYVVVRTAGSVLDLAAIADRTAGLDVEFRHGPWQVGVFGVEDLADHAPSLQAELAQETGAPALTAYVIDSDAVAIEAWSASTGFWRARLVSFAINS